MSDISYSSIGREIVMRVDLSKLSGRSKSNLLYDLLEMTGVDYDSIKACNTVDEVEQLLSNGLLKLWEEK